jgi:hypothetical protein
MIASMSVIIPEMPQEKMQSLNSAIREVVWCTDEILQECPAIREGRVDVASPEGENSKSTESWAT